jgi:hypothetical protein
LHPLSDLFVVIIGFTGVSISKAEIFKLFIELIFLGDGCRLGKWSKPAMTQQHGVGWAELRYLVQTAADKIPSLCRVAFLRQVRRIAIDNRLK